MIPAGYAMCWYFWKTFQEGALRPMNFYWNGSAWVSERIGGRTVWYPAEAKVRA